MEKKWLIGSIFILITIIIILPAIIILNKTNLSPTAKNSSLEECKTLEYNGNDKTNIVFFSTKEQAEKYQNFFLSITPLKDYKNSFNFFYIPNYSPECEIYKNIALLCYNQDIIKKASSCPNDYIVVIKDQPSDIRSSSYMNVMSLNSQHSLTVLEHEFGHAFANFAEEYTPADIPSGSKNCQPSCNSFDINNGCFQGCSKDNYKRSIENGVMRTLNSNVYGIFNERIIIEKINKNKTTTTGSVISEGPDCLQQKYYLIEANYSNKQINVLDKSVQQGCVGTNGAGNFQYNLVLNDGTNYTQQEFNPELIFTDSQTSQEEEIQGQTYTSDKSFMLKVPVIDNSKTLEIYKDNQKITEINLQNPNFRPCII